MQRISLSISRIRRFSASNHVTLADHRLLKQVLESCKSQPNSKCVLLQAHAHILKLDAATSHTSLAASSLGSSRSLLASPTQT
ncbi:BnaA02g11470D [Brassica napus]|uniref:BnaA02g11470D protein n=1 Tax=Brassica napus TaxID=3708 RepID=A0A078FVA7_BRANA|nr:BnaA02g11470D [Brassica napus]